MKQVHKKLMDNSSWYASWHNQKVHQLVHWSAFVMVGVLITSLVVSNINLQPVSSSASGSAVICDYYASPNGTSGGNGSQGSPWDLQTALNQTSVMTAGKTLCLKGGTYNSKYISTLNGGTVRSAPGEWAKIDGYKSTILSANISATDMTIPVASVSGWPPADQLFEIGIDNEIIRIYGTRNGNSLTVYNERGSSGSTGGAAAHSAGAVVSLAGNPFYISGNNTTYRDFEIMDSDPVRSGATSGGYTLGRGIGMFVVGSGNKIVNTVIHDTGGGVFTSNSSSNTEVYGNIIYNNGIIFPDGTPHGHGEYLENGSGYSKIYSNIVYNSYNLGMQAYGVTASYVGGDFQDNVFAGSGAPVGSPHYNAIYGTNTQKIPSINIERNHYYHQPGNGGYGVIVGYEAGIINATFNGNYVIGGGNVALQVQNTTTLTGSGNHIYDPNASFQSYLHLSGFTGFNWNNNVYDKAGTSDVFAIPSQGVYNFTAWKSATGLDSTSTATSVAMPNRVIIVPNTYEAGRANVYIYNTAGGTTANIDLSQAGLTNGQNYEIRNAQNYLGPVVASGTYSSSSPIVTVSLAGAAATVAQPIGGSITVPTTCAAFCPMVVVPTSGGGSDTTPPAVSMTAPASGSTVSGSSVPVSASASDNVGVVGVQFKLDGTNLSSEDTSSPYSVNWNTTTTTNGTHSLTATGRDAAGNTTTATAVSVTVNNAAAQVATPTISPNGGSFTSAQSVTLATSTSGASIRYTTDGSTPSSTVGTLYSSAFNIATSSTVKAIGYKSGSTDSGVASAIFTINITPPADTTPPAVSMTAPASGSTVSGTVTVTANASDNVGVVGVQFKLDGANLNAEDTSSPYSTSWNTTTTANGTHSLTATGRDAAGNTTTSIGFTVTVNNVLPQVVTPTISPNGGTFTSAQTVTLATSTSGATIRYTTDSSIPSSTVGTVYTAPFTVSTTKTVKAIAYKSGSTDSTVSTATFTINPVSSGPAPKILSYSLIAKTQTSGTIRWKTNIASTGSIAYGTNRNNLNLTVSDPTTGSCTSTSCTHTLAIPGLTRNTTYYYKITATNNGASVTSNRASFRTSR